MKQNKIQVIGSFIIISILIIMMTGVIFLSILPKVLQKLNLSNNYINELLGMEDTSDVIDIKYEQMYPFQDVYRGDNEVNILQQYKNIVSKVEKVIETSTSEKLFGYEKFIEYSYIYNDMIFYKIVSNSNNSTRVNIGDGYFSQIIKKRNIEECGDRLIDFNEYLQKLNIDLLYIQAPFKISQIQTLSSIYKDYSNENMNNLMNYINGKVNYMDLRQNIEQSGLNHLQLFYKTDNHWLPETGLWATGEISKYLNSNYDMDLQIDNINPDKYNIKRYPNMYLGADGRYVSLKNAQPEDFSLITPNFTTKLHVQMLDRGINKTDTFENTLIDWKQIQYKNYYKISQYSAYGYGNRPLIEIHNELVNNNKKILIIRDSFSDVFAPFLALENEYTSVIDLRGFDGSLKTYINEFNPDMVIVMYTGNMVADLEDATTANNYEDLINMWNFE